MICHVIELQNRRKFQVQREGTVPYSTWSTYSLSAINSASCSHLPDMIVHLIPRHSLASPQQHITTMNSLFQLPTIVCQTVLHSFSNRKTAPSSQTWCIKMVDLGHLQCSHPRGASDNVAKAHKSKFRGSPSPCPTYWPHTTNSDESVTRAAQPPELRITSQHGAPTSPPPSPPSPFNGPATYLCTFCWRPHHQSKTPARAIGRCCRLACTLCYNALLDLAVC